MASSSQATNLTGEPDTNGYLEAHLVQWRTGAVQRIRTGTSSRTATLWPPA